MSRDAVDFWIIVVAGVGQTVFVSSWAVLPWWREWIGRALMTKAFALMLLIDLAILFEFVQWPHEEDIEFGVHVLVALGIWMQVWALHREIRCARRETREVSGTNPSERVV